jgi:PIN domain nuclease of toxin-antitoxin system
MMAYLDTNALVWLSEKNFAKFRSSTLETIGQADLLYSPIVLLELEYLFEIKRSILPTRDIQRKVEFELGVRLCTLPFDQVATTALDEKWTRDPFDRLIVANAKTNGLAPLITADLYIAQHYPRVLW